MVTLLDSTEENRLRRKIDVHGRWGIRVLAGLAAEPEAPPRHRVALGSGIDPAAPLVQRFLRRRVEMIGELELAYEMCECPIAAITGTNGKTTTTQLVEAMLSACGVKTVAAGNIGPAFSARVRQSGDLDLMTLEVSSSQLEGIRRFRADIAVWLNFAPDHLDRGHMLEEYRAARLRIFENQRPQDWAIVNGRDALPKLTARRITFSASARGFDFDLREGVIHYRGEPVLALRETQLRGAHDAENLMAALGVGVARGLRFEDMRAPLCAFHPLPHRCETVRTLNGVEWVNDSKATNLDAVEKALLSETRPVVLITGGKDKGFAYDALTELVARKCRAAVLMGELANSLEAFWLGRIPCKNAGRSFEVAVREARALAQPGDVVLFSPGTSSFDLFTNYADRGNQFRALVQALPDPITV